MTRLYATGHPRRMTWHLAQLNIGRTRPAHDLRAEPGSLHLPPPVPAPRRPDGHRRRAQHLPGVRSLQGRPDVLRTGELLDAGQPAEAAVAAVLDAPEGDGDSWDAGEAVDPDAARLERRRQAVGPSDVVGLDVGGQPVAVVVGYRQGLGFRLERVDAD